MGTRNIYDPKYRQRAKAQMFSWASGRPYHDSYNDECCPDFSCCYSSLFESDAAKRWERYRERYGSKS